VYLLLCTYLNLLLVFFCRVLCNLLKCFSVVQTPTKTTTEVYMCVFVVFKAIILLSPIVLVQIYTYVFYLLFLTELLQLVYILIEEVNLAKQAHPPLHPSTSYSSSSISIRSLLFVLKPVLVVFKS